MEASVHAHILYVGDDADSKRARKELDRLSKKSKDFEYMVVDVDQVGIQKIRPPVLFADEGEFATMEGIKWFVKQQLWFGKQQLGGRIEVIDSPVEQERRLDDRKENILCEFESRPDLMFSRDLVKELASYTKMDPAELQKTSDSLADFLNDFALKKYGVPMDQKTKTFLCNELIYLILKFSTGNK